MSIKLVEDNLVPEVWTVTFFGSIPITFCKREDMEQYFDDLLHKGNGKIPYEKIPFRIEHKKNYRIDNLLDLLGE
jgi:hypothetical protein